MDNDIAVMVTGSPFEYTEYVRPACLPESAAFNPLKLKSSSDITDVRKCIISGWGTTEKGV